MKLPVNRIRYFGIFDMEKFMNAMINWFRQEGYTDVYETAHKFKVTEGGEFDITFVGERAVTSYWRFKITVQVKTFGSRQVEITKGNQVVVASHGRITIWIAPELIEDWQGTFSGKGFKEKLKDFFKKYIVDAQTGIYWDKLFYESRNGLEPAIRSALNFETVMRSG